MSLTGYPLHCSVPHGAEIPYIFGNTADPTDGACRTIEAMMDYWISFAVTLNPNDGKGIQRQLLTQSGPLSANG